MFAKLPKHNATLISYILLGIVIALIGGLLHFVASSYVIIGYLKYVVVGLFLMNLFLSLKIFNLPLFHPYVLFLGIFGLYMVSRIFIDLIGIVDFGVTTQFSDYTFDDAVKVRLLINIGLAIFALQVGFMSFHKYENNVTLKYTPMWERLGIVFFYLGLPFLAYQYIMVGLDVIDLGYGARLSGELTYKNSILTSVMVRISLAGFFIFLASIPHTKHFKWHLLVFVIINSLQLLEGGRYHTFCLYLMLFAYVFYTRNIRLKPWMYVFFVSTLLLFGTVIGIIRSESNQFNAQQLYEFVYEQGLGIQIVGHTIEYYDEIDYKPQHLVSHVHYYVDLILARITGEEVPNDKVKRMEQYGNLEFVLTYKVNERALIGGWDMAISYISEAFMLGKEFMVFVISFLVGLSYSLIGQRKRWHGFSLLVIIMILPSWLFIPRDSLFDFIPDNLTNFFVVSFILVGGGISLRLKRKINSVLINN